MFEHFVIKNDDDTYTYKIEIKEPNEDEEKVFWVKSFASEKQALVAMLSQIVIDEMLDDEIEITIK